MAGPDKFVLIATGGMLPPDTVDFGPMAKARMFALVTEWNDLIKKKKPPFTLPATVRFVRFNFDTNHVSMLDHVFPDKGIKRPSVRDSDWTVVPGGPGVDISTHDNNANNVKTLSITNIYNTVLQCPDGAVLEVSILSHAFIRGPVLINTSDTHPQTGSRDPKDMDGRPKDFKSDMGDPANPNALKNFIKKFDKTGHFRIYGCNVQDVVTDVQIVANVVATGAVRKSNVVTVTMTAAHGLKKNDSATTSDVADASFNASFTIADVPSAKTFTFAQNGADATSGGGVVFTSNGTDYKRSATFQVIDQAFVVPVNSKSALGRDLLKRKAPANIVLDMWTEVMNEAERDIKAHAKAQARAQGKPFKDWEAIENAAWASTPAKVRNRLANSLLMMHRQLDPDFYPAPNTTDSTAAPAQKTVTKAWADVLRLCAKKLAESYIFKAADQLNSSGITCHGAVPGVGGNNEKDPRHLGLMRVCANNKHFGCDDSFGAWLMFYRLFFFINSAGKQVPAFDDHNYARLGKTTVPIVNALAGS
jgi:hypothetical protein